MINLNLLKAIWLSGFRIGQGIGIKEESTNYGYVNEKEIWEKEVKSKLDEININLEKEIESKLDEINIKFEKDWENIP